MTPEQEAAVASAHPDLGREGVLAAIFDRYRPGAENDHPPIESNVPC